MIGPCLSGLALFRRFCQDYSLLKEQNRKRNGDLNWNLIAVLSNLSGLYEKLLQYLSVLSQNLRRHVSQITNVGNADYSENFARKQQSLAGTC